MSAICLIAIIVAVFVLILAVTMQNKREGLFLCRGGCGCRGGCRCARCPYSVLA